MNSTVFIQILPSQLAVNIDDDTWSAPLVRSENGKLSAASRERLVIDLRAFLQKHGVKSGEEAMVALPARGVTLRTLEIPRTPRPEMEQVLRFQIENEFPVPPEELSWGWQPVATGNNSQTQKVLVLAVKREQVKEWQELFDSVGLKQVWTLGSLARTQLVPEGTIRFAQLHADDTFSELALVDGGSPTAIRSLSWSVEQLQTAVQTKFEIGPSEAVQWLAEWREGSFSRVEQRREFEELLRAEAQKLATMVSSLVRGKTIFLSGSAATLPGFSEALKREAETNVEVLPGESGSGISSSTLRGLTAASSGKRRTNLLTLRSAEAPAETKRKVVKVSEWKWPAIAAALLIVALLMKHAEAMIQKPRLAKRIEEIKRYQKQLPAVDTEIEFLQFVQTNQPPYLDAIHAIAASAAPGTKVDGLTMNRRGDLSIRATMQNAQQATDLRTKMYDTVLFSAVVLEEQTPSPDGQKLTIRMGAQLRTYPEVKEALAAAEAKTKTTAPTTNNAVKVVKK